MAFIKDAKRIGVFGASGSGKSTLTASLLKARTRVIAFDPQMDYSSKRDYTTVHSCLELVRHLKDRWSRSFKVAYVPRMGADCVQELHMVSMVLVRLQEPYFAYKHDRKITFVVDELNKSYPVAGIRADLRGFGELCSRGRHYGIEVIGASQRMAEVNTNFRGNLSEVYFLRLIEHNDIAAVRATLGPKYAEQVRGFPNFRFLRRCENGAITLGDIKRQ